MPDAAAMQALGEALGRAARPGCVAALVGDLGAGKTTLAQGVGRGLGIVAPVVSPTFGLVHELEGGRLTLLHADLYRLDDPSEAEGLGLEERLEDELVGLVEWPGRAPEVLPLDHLVLTVTIDDPSRADAGPRTVRARWTGPVAARWWQEACGG